MEEEEQKRRNLLIVSMSMSMSIHRIMWKVRSAPVTLWETLVLIPIASWGFYLTVARAGPFHSQDSIYVLPVAEPLLITALIGHSQGVQVSDTTW